MQIRWFLFPSGARLLDENVVERWMVQYQRSIDRLPLLLVF